MIEDTADCSTVGYSTVGSGSRTGALRLAIVGCGPRGLQCLEAISRKVPPERLRNLRITVYETANKLGAGRIYDPSQSRVLKMNFATQHINFWHPRDTLLPECCQSLIGWLRSAYPEFALADQFIPRAIVGEYLHDCFELVKQRLERYAPLEIRRSAVHCIQRLAAEWRVDDRDSRSFFDQVVLTTGHEGLRGSSVEEASEQFVFPVEHHLSTQRIPPGSRIRVRGFGLTAIDAVLVLTEGRGGAFSEAKPLPVYTKSSNEPSRIDLYSRSGRPMLAKPTAEVALVEDAFWQPFRAELRSQRLQHGALRFREDLWNVVASACTAMLQQVGIAATLEQVGNWFSDWSHGCMSPTVAQRVMLQSHAVATGRRAQDIPFALGEAWRKLYPELVELIGFGGLQSGHWRSYELTRREMERIAFGPPAENVGKLLRLIQDGIVRCCTAPRPNARYDQSLGGVLASPRELLADGPIAKLIGEGKIQLDSSSGAVRVDREGGVGGQAPGLAVFGRVTEGWVVGNDTLSRNLHTHIENWAESMVVKVSEIPDKNEVAEEALRGNCRGELPLCGRLEPWMLRLLSGSHLSQLVSQYGSPLNLVCSAPMLRNTEELLDVSRERDLDFRVYFARKSNKCLAFVDAAVAHDLGVDTASENEIRQSLDRNLPANRAICTAAIKNESLLRLCVEREVCIAVDNADELQAVVGIAASLRCHAQIAIRLGGFRHQQAKLPTRFGFDVEQDTALLSKLKELPVQVDGIHFHLDGYDAAQRVSAIAQSLVWIERLREVGQRPSFLDVGGGIPMSYLEHREQWSCFWSQLHVALLNRRPPLTYRNHGLGLTTDGDQVIGRPNSYPYFQSPTRGAWLASILDDSFQQRSIADHLRSAKVQLRCEPGRSLLDGCGMTVARVEFRKRNADGDWLIGLSMNRTQCRTSSDDYLVDPILLPAENRAESPMSGYLVGAYCTESELLSLRKFIFPQGVRRGDLVVFPNTAGYLMHFLESRSHQFPLAKNLVVSANDYSLDPIEQL